MITKRKSPHIARTRLPHSIPDSAGQVPVTSAMLRAVRDELLDRMGSYQKINEAEFCGVYEHFARVEGRFAKIDERFAKIDERFAKIDERFEQIEGRLSRMEATMLEMSADIKRMVVLVEEQHTRNTIVLEALRALMDRQDRGEKRIDEMENTLRYLASSRR